MISLIVLYYFSYDIWYYIIYWFRYIPLFWESSKFIFYYEFPCVFQKFIYSIFILDCFAMFQSSESHPHFSQHKFWDFPIFSTDRCSFLHLFPPLCMIFIETDYSFVVLILFFVKPSMIFLSISRFVIFLSNVTVSLIISISYCLKFLMSSHILSMSFVFAEIVMDSEDLLCSRYWLPTSFVVFKISCFYWVLFICLLVFIFSVSRYYSSSFQMVDSFSKC